MDGSLLLKMTLEVASSPTTPRRRRRRIVGSTENGAFARRLVLEVSIFSISPPKFLIVELLTKKTTQIDIFRPSTIFPNLCGHRRRSTGARSGGVL